MLFAKKDLAGYTNSIISQMLDFQCQKRTFLEEKRSLLFSIDLFETYFSTKKSISLAMITMHGIKPTYWSEELIEDEVTIEELMT